MNFAEYLSWSGSNIQQPAARQSDDQVTRNFLMLALDSPGQRQTVVQSCCKIWQVYKALLAFAFHVLSGANPTRSGGRPILLTPIRSHFIINLSLTIKVI